MNHLRPIVLLLLAGCSRLQAPLRVGPGGALLRDGKPFQAIGVNYFDCFARTLRDPADRSYEQGFAELARRGIPFCRFMACGYWPKDWDLYLRDRRRYFRLLDRVVRAAERHGIGLIPSLFWHSATVPDIVGEPRNQWGNPRSKTHAFMRRYVREVVTRYHEMQARYQALRAAEEDVRILAKRWEPFAGADGRGTMGYLRLLIDAQERLAQAQQDLAELAAEVISLERLPELAEQARQQKLESLQEGQIVVGTVRSIMPYGAFVDIGGIDGLLHISDMSYARIKDPGELVQEGQSIEVKVLKVDRQEGRISLGLKQVQPDPWHEADRKWPVDAVVTGRVTRLADFGAFVELEEGVEGLIPISELSFFRRIRHPSEVVNVGDMVQVRVMNVDSEQRRIGLSLKRVGEDPWLGASRRWPPESIAEGVVKSITNFGAFVELAPGVEGLIHISELSETPIRAITDVVREGQTVQVKVLAVDEERRRIALSIRQLASMPEYTGPASAEPDEQRPKRRRKRPLRGGLDL